MLLGAIFTNVVLSGSLVQSTMTMVTGTGIPAYSLLVIIALVALLSIKTVISESKVWNKHLNDSFNMAVVPLLFSFTMIVFFKVTQII